MTASGESNAEAIRQAQTVVEAAKRKEAAKKAESDRLAPRPKPCPAPNQTASSPSERRPRFERMRRRALFLFTLRALSRSCVARKRKLQDDETKRQKADAAARTKYKAQIKQMQALGPVLALSFRVSVCASYRS